MSYQANQYQEVVDSQTQESLNYDENNFQVIVRVRPFNSKELLSCDSTIQLPEEQKSLTFEQSDLHFQNSSSLKKDQLQLNSNKILQEIQRKKYKNVIRIDNNWLYVYDNEYKGTERKEKPFMFDQVFDKKDSNQQVFLKGIAPALENLLQGYNVTIIAYGMTGSGKTHSIFGTHNSQCSEKGIAHQSLDFVFQALRANNNNSNSNSNNQFKFSYLEIYNENVRDLLSELQKTLNITEDPIKGVQVSDLQEFVVNDLQQVEELISIGNQKRVLASTNANQHSSRSHAILQLQITMKGNQNGLTQDILQSKLTLIDLAGSEKCTVNDFKSKGHIEGANINRSLLALGNCINILATNSKKLPSFVPYRDSKLTRLLKDSLGGNSRTIMIACVSPTQQCLEETVNTLNYASRAKNIKQRVVRNVVENGRKDEAFKFVIQQLRQDFDFLKNMQSNKLPCNHCSSSPTPIIQNYLTNTNFPNILTDSNNNEKQQLQQLQEFQRDIMSKAKEIHSIVNDRIGIAKLSLEKELKGIIDCNNSFEDHDQVEIVQQICQDLFANIDEEVEIKQVINELNMFKQQNDQTYIELQTQLNEDDNNNELQERFSKLQEEMQGNEKMMEQFQKALQVIFQLKQQFFQMNEQRKLMQKQLLLKLTDDINQQITIKLKKQQMEAFSILQLNHQLQQNLHEKENLLTQKEMMIEKMQTELLLQNQKLLQKDLEYKQIEIKYKKLQQVNNCYTEKINPHNKPTLSANNIGERQDNQIKCNNFNFMRGQNKEYCQRKCLTPQSENQICSLMTQDEQESNDQNSNCSPSTQRKQKLTLVTSNNEKRGRSPINKNQVISLASNSKKPMQRFLYNELVQMQNSTKNQPVSSKKFLKQAKTRNSNQTPIIKSSYGNGTPQQQLKLSNLEQKYQSKSKSPQQFNSQKIMTEQLNFNSPNDIKNYSQIFNTLGSQIDKKEPAIAKIELFQNQNQSPQQVLDPKKSRSTSQSKRYNLNSIEKISAEFQQFDFEPQDYTETKEKESIFAQPTALQKTTQQQIQFGTEISFNKFNQQIITQQEHQQQYSKLKEKKDFMNIPDLELQYNKLLGQIKLENEKQQPVQSQDTSFECKENYNPCTISSSVSKKTIQYCQYQDEFANNNNNNKQQNKLNSTSNKKFNNQKKFDYSEKKQLEFLGNIDFSENNNTSKDQFNIVNISNLPVDEEALLNDDSKKKDPNNILYDFYFNDETPTDQTKLFQKICTSKSEMNLFNQDNPIENNNNNKNKKTDDIQEICKVGSPVICKNSRNYYTMGLQLPPFKKCTRALVEDEM